MGSDSQLDQGLLGRGVLGDGLGAFRDGVLGKLSGEDETDGGLDLARRDGRALVVVRKTGSLSGDPLEDVVHEGVHDGHGLRGDSGVGVHLLEHTVDVHGVRLLPGLPLLLVSRSGDLLALRGLLRSLRRRLRRHLDLIPSGGDRSNSQPYIPLGERRPSQGSAHLRANGSASLSDLAVGGMREGEGRRDAGRRRVEREREITRDAGRKGRGRKAQSLPLIHCLPISSGGEC